MAIGSLGWGRAGCGVWQHVPIAPSGPGRGEPWVLASGGEPELRELCELVSAAPNLGRVRWALARFEMGCERTSDAEALSDYLLALESLLDVTDETGRASMGLRLAALCAEEGERKAVRGRLEAAFALERAFMAGSVADPEIDAPDGDLPPAHLLVAELEQHARALLRDVVCGYLSPDLCSVADDVLLALSFGDGSIGSIVYASGGDRSLPKEQLEVLGGGLAAVLDDFRSLRVHLAGTAKHLGGRLPRQDKGHVAELAAFFEALRSGTTSPVDPQGAAHVTRVTFAAVESARTGLPVTL